MNLRDCRTFPESAHNVHVSWIYIETWINDQIKELNLQLEPDFQRGHVWTETQRINYLEYIISSDCKSGLDLFFNHPNWGRSWEGDFVLVDGLQRITTVLKFVNNEIKIFGDYYLKDFEDKKYLRNFNFHVNIASLKTKKDVLNWYLLMNAGGTPHSKEEIERVKKLLETEK